MQKHELSERQIARVLAVLRRRLARVHQGNVTSLARELGIKQPSLWTMLRERSRPSLRTAETLAHLEGVSVESVLAFPRDRAAEIAREGGIPESAIARVMAEPEGDEERVLGWLDRMRAVAILGGLKTL